MPPSIRFVITPAVLLTIALIRLGGTLEISGWRNSSVSKEITLNRIPPAEAGGSFIPSLQKIGKIPRIPPAEAGGSFIPSLQKIGKIPRIPPAEAGGSFIPSFCFPLLSAQVGIERSTGFRRWDSRAFSVSCRAGLKDPPAPAGGIHKAQTCLNANDRQVAAPSSKTQRYEDSRVSMGCVYTVVSYGRDLARLREAAAAALDEVDRIDRLMSNYKKDSELSRLNREAAKAPVKVDHELFDFIAECLRYGRESEGAFDITVGPLMKAWGFFRGEGRMPGEAELARARNSVGYQHVILNQKDGTIFFDKEGVELDLGGIAKGYAVDRAMTVLKQYGVTSALLSAGGSTTYALGAPPGKPAWEIEVQDPVERDKIATRVRLKDRALSVSGSQEKFFELNGARYSHVMDPRTGRPVQGVLSVAVITDDGVSGDALDNVFYVFGAERSRASLKKFSASEVIFFLPDSRKEWKMVRIRRKTYAE